MIIMVAGYLVPDVGPGSMSREGCGIKQSH